MSSQQSDDSYLVRIREGDGSGETFEAYIIPILPSLSAWLYTIYITFLSLGFLMSKRG
jgi:hypothetical protein